MQSINVLSLTSNVDHWLANSQRPRILHLFERACNLVNERKEVLSIVTPQVGDGPFNLVVEEDICFSNRLSLESQVFIAPHQLHLGKLNINTNDAKLWSPYPDWEKLHAKKSDIFKQLTSLPITNCESSNSLISSLTTPDLPSALIAAQKLAGLGIGLTPAGDDFLMGAIYAAWIIHPAQVAIVLAQEVATAAAPLTTSLSAAWLRAAGRGEAGILWHKLFAALLLGNEASIQLQITQLLSVGHTSGADALAGFISVCTADGMIRSSAS